MKRASAIISGRVQKAGYRDLVDDIAYKYKIKGFVRNLKDKSVEVVAEGEKASLDSFFKEIEIKVPPVIVENISITWEDYKGEYSYFEIVREDGFAELGERIDVANRYLITMIEMQKEALNKLDTSIEKQDLMIEKQEHMIDLQTDNNAELKGLRNDTKSYLDRRFSEIQNELTDIKSALIKAGIKI